MSFMQNAGQRATGIFFMRGRKSVSGKRICDEGFERVTCPEYLEFETLESAVMRQVSRCVRRGPVGKVPKR